MAIVGQIVLFKFPQTDLTIGKLHPPLLIKPLSNNYDDWLVCMISTKTIYLQSNLPFLNQEF